MIRAAICDDDKQMLNIMKSVIEETFSSHSFPCRISCYQTGSELLKDHMLHPFQILFLDILMPEQNGFDVAKEVRTISDKTLLLFVTSEDELVYDSFDYHPFFFLRKGEKATFSKSLAEAVKKIIDYIKRNEYMTLDLGAGEFRSVCMQDILYLKSNAHYTEYHMNDKSMLLIREPLSDSETKLERFGFVRIHKSYIVNIYKVKKIIVSRYPEIQLYSNIILPIGRRYKEAVSEKYKERMRNML